MRDVYGVPHISAASVDDAIYALGFVHAQDRLWQMEVNRRTAAGRLAEVFGASALETDRFLRTLGVRRAAEANFKRLDKDTRALLETYAAGVNAFIDYEPGAADRVLAHRRASSEPWTPVDSLGWIKMMAWDLGGNWRNELLRMRLSKTLPLARIHEFLPPYPGEAPPEITDLRRLYNSIEKEAPRLRAKIGTDPIFRMSKNGVCPYFCRQRRSRVEQLGGVRRAQRHRQAAPRQRPAPRPHGAGGLVLRAHLRAGARGDRRDAARRAGDRARAQLAFAWGFTNTGPDVQDLYIERLDGAGNYLTPEGPKPFTLHEEVIKVKGGEDVRLQVRVSRHGPVISDVSRAAQEAAPRGHVIAMQWTALREDDLTMQSAVKIARAKDWPGFLAALRDYHSPQQNIVYADAQGNIGFVAAGRVPVRKPDNDLKGLAPAPGWLAKYDWAGFIPFEELPRSLQPGGRRDHDGEPPHHAARLPALHHERMAAALPREPHRASCSARCPSTPSAASRASRATWCRCR